MSNDHSGAVNSLSTPSCCDNNNNNKPSAHDGGSVGVIFLPSSGSGFTNNSNVVAGDNAGFPQQSQGVSAPTQLHQCAPSTGGDGAVFFALSNTAATTNYFPFGSGYGYFSYCNGVALSPTSPSGQALYVTLQKASNHNNSRINHKFSGNQPQGFV
eukprot:8081504-Ditylum_brightwellii.AAC.1